MITDTIRALEHALYRLNTILHNYEHTDFKLIESSLIHEYRLNSVPVKDWTFYLKNKGDDRDGH